MKKILKSIKVFKVVMLLLVVFFNLTNASYADIIRESEDVNPEYKKDFNGDGKYILVLDPGHGGSKSVANRNKYFFDNSESNTIYENDLDLRLASLIKDELVKDGRLLVYMTRESDIDVSLADRGVIAKNYNADLMMSIHFNNMPTYTQSASSMGMEIWQSVVDMYKPYGLAKTIFKEFNKNHFLQVIRGLKERVSGDSYWDYSINNAVSNDTGNPADYYGVIKAGARNGVPTVIVEHAFFSNDNDFAMMQDDENIKEMAKREAKAILDWFYN